MPASSSLGDPAAASGSGSAARSRGVPADEADGLAREAPGRRCATRPRSPPPRAPACRVAPGGRSCSRSSSTVSSIVRLRPSAVLILASSSRSSTGFERKSSAPASMPRTRSSTAFSAVIRTTGISLVAGSSFSIRRALIPSISGIITSSRTRSGGFCRHPLERLEPVAGALGREPELLQVLLEVVDVQRLVVDDQDAAGPLRGRVGRRGHRGGRWRSDQLDQAHVVDRLRDEVVAAGLDRALPVTRHDERADRDDRHLEARLADRAHRVEAAHPGQADVHQDQVGPLAGRELDRGLAVGRQREIVGPLEDLHQQVAVEARCPRRSAASCSLRVARPSPAPVVRRGPSKRQIEREPASRRRGGSRP